MQSFRLVMDPETLHRRGARPAIGLVHVEIEGAAFPAKDWSDFALVFLRDYLAAVRKLRTRVRSRVSFFEGPFELRFHRVGDAVDVSAVERGKRAALTTTVPYTDLLEYSMQAIMPWIEHEQAVGA